MRNVGGHVSRDSSRIPQKTRSRHRSADDAGILEGTAREMNSSRNDAGIDQRTAPFHGGTLYNAGIAVDLTGTNNDLSGGSSPHIRRGGDTAGIAPTRARAAHRNGMVIAADDHASPRIGKR